MSWIFIAIVAYLFLAIANVGDKLFLGNFVPDYKVYASMIGVFGMAVFVVAPWYLVWPGFLVFIISLVSGAFFIAALLLFFFSLHSGEASRVIPFVGGLVPIFSLIFSVIFLDELFTLRQLFAFLVLIVGSTLLIRLPHHTYWWECIWERIHPPHHAKEVVVAALSALLFAASFVSTKYVYTHTDFLNGFLWVRIGSFLFVLVVLGNAQVRRAFINSLKRMASRTGAMFLGNQMFGGVGFFLQSYAISLGSVALVNALQGVQYVFVIVLAVGTSLLFPRFATDEDVDMKIIIEKVFAVLIVGVGLWIITT